MIGQDFTVVIPLCEFRTGLGSKKNGNKKRENDKEKRNQERARSGWIDAYKIFKLHVRIWFTFAVYCMHLKG
jgi:hypothetical protein